MLDGHRGSICQVDINNNDKYFISGSFDNKVKLWKFVTGE